LFEQLGPPANVLIRTFESLFKSYFNDVEILVRPVTSANDANNNAESCENDDVISLKRRASSISSQENNDNGGNYVDL
jgi:hypothetical protein